MKTKLNLLAAEIFLAALGTGFGQSTLQFSTNIYYVAENAGLAILTVQRTGDTNAVVSVDYASANGTAMAGPDYTATNGTLTFLAGETNELIIVPILNDSAVQAATYETFTVTLSAPTNAVLGARTTANARITDNDKGLAFEFASYSVAEDAGSVLIGVVRADDGDFPVSVDYFTTKKTPQDSITAALIARPLSCVGTHFPPGSITRPMKARYRLFLRRKSVYYASPVSANQYCFGISMRVAPAFFAASLIGLLGCRSPTPPERRSISLSMPPYAEVVCELRAYRIGDRTYAKEEFETLKQSSDRDLRWEVSGFLWEIVSPAQFAGKALSSHFDGPLASGDPFKAFTFGRRYVMKVS